MSLDDIRDLLLERIEAEEDIFPLVADVGSSEPVNTAKFNDAAYRRAFVSGMTFAQVMEAWSRLQDGGDDEEGDEEDPEDFEEGEEDDKEED